MRHPGGTSPAAAPSKSSLIIKSLGPAPLEDELLELDELELLELEDELELDELELEELELEELDVLELVDELELDELPLFPGSLSAPHASSRVDRVLTIPKRAR